MRKFFISALLATSSLGLAPQAAVAATAADDTVVADSDAAQNLKQIEKIFASLFDTKNAAPIDPKRLELAQKTTSQIMPDGVYSKMMNGLMDKFMGALLAQPGGMSDMEISLTTGVDIPEGGLDEAKRKAITEVLDPHHAKRADALKNTMGPLMDKMARVIEPPMREGLARAYARKFSVEQLAELNRFFATPTGGFYASESFLLQADPEVMQAMFSALPAMFSEFSNPESEIEKQMADIPPVRKVSELSSAEKDKVAKLLGTTADALSEFGMVEEATAAAQSATDAAAEDPFANESGTEPWWDRANWDKADQKKIAELETKADALGEQSQAASTAYLDFETEVMLRVRERYLAKGWKPSDSSE